MNNIPGEFILMFLGMVFIAVFLLSQGVVVPVAVLWLSSVTLLLLGQVVL